MKTKVTFLTAIAIALSTVFCLIQALPASADTTVVLASGFCTTTCENSSPIDTTNCKKIRLTVGVPQEARTTNKKATVSYHIFDSYPGALGGALADATCGYDTLVCTQDVDTPGVSTGFEIIIANFSPSVFGGVSYALYCRESDGS